MEEEKIYKSEAVWMNLRHLGIILSNLAIFFSCVTIFIPLSNILAFFGIAMAFMLLFAFTIVSTIVTAGMVWFTDIIPTMWSWLQDSNDKVMLITKLFELMPFTALLGALLCFSSSILLQFIKQDKRKGRIVAGYILGAICLIVCILAFAGVMIQ